MNKVTDEERKHNPPCLYGFLQNNIGCGSLFQRRPGEPNGLRRGRPGAWRVRLGSWEEQRDGMRKMQSVTEGQTDGGESQAHSLSDKYSRFHVSTSSVSIYRKNLGRDSLSNKATVLWKKIVQLVFFTFSELQPQTLICFTGILCVWNACHSKDSFFFFVAKFLIPSNLLHFQKYSLFLLVCLMKSC